jgi:hypothetical protein
MRLLALLGLVAAAGCFSERTDYRSRELACSRADGSCPNGLVCAFDRLCYRIGEQPFPPDASTSCVPQSKEEICGARVCGMPFNNCGDMVPCGALGGACPGTQQCDSAGACVDHCTPLTMCPAGDECGAIDPGCGRPLLTCGGACPTERPTCASNHCICVPLAMCPAEICGSYPNGCGGTLECGACSANRICETTLGTCRDRTMAEACAGFACGTVQSGSMTYTCGTCVSPDVCSNNMGGTCGCVPTADPCAGLNCGTMPDGCGTMVDCDPNHTCNIGLCYECLVGICTFRTQCT